MEFMVHLNVTFNHEWLALPVVSTSITKLVAYCREFLDLVYWSIRYVFLSLSFIVGLLFGKFLIYTELYVFPGLFAHH